MLTVDNWKPTVNIGRFFTPTRFDKPKEIRKARIKNQNLPFLQHMYHGSATVELHCAMSNAPGFIDFLNLHTGENKQRFNIDFNHIRQKQTGSRVAGFSVDKGYYDPSAVFREKYLQQDALAMLEFVCIMPISQEVHRYVTQDSANADLTLVNFPKTTWSWILQAEENYDQFFKSAKMVVPSYSWMIAHLSDISNPPLRSRVDYIVEEVEEWWGKVTRPNMLKVKVI